jgi:hypothetical protein
MPRTSFSGVDPWDGKLHLYEGTLLLPLLERLGAPRGVKALELSAKNDYQVSVRAEDLRAGRYLLTWMLDGATMAEQSGMKRRGALMVAIDFDGNPALDPEVYKYQLVWQLNRITLR